MRCEKEKVQFHKNILSVYCPSSQLWLLFLSILTDVPSLLVHPHRCAFSVYCSSSQTWPLFYWLPSLSFLALPCSLSWWNKSYKTEPKEIISIVNCFSGLVIIIKYDKIIIGFSDQSSPGLNQRSLSLQWMMVNSVTPCCTLCWE